MLCKTIGLVGTGIIGSPINYVAGTVRVRVYPRVRVGLGSNFEYGSGTGTGNGPVLRVRVG